MFCYGDSLALLKNKESIIKRLSILDWLPADYYKILR